MVKEQFTNIRSVETRSKLKEKKKKPPNLLVVIIHWKEKGRSNSDLHEV